MSQPRPVHEIRLGSIRAAIWANGNGRARYNATYSRVYRGEGGWRESTSFGGADSLVLSHIASMAADWICDHESAPTEPQPSQ